jgi:hypothetical protein
MVAIWREMNEGTEAPAAIDRELRPVLASYPSPGDRRHLVLVLREGADIDARRLFHSQSGAASSRVL